MVDDIAIAWARHEIGEDRRKIEQEDGCIYKGFARDATHQSPRRCHKDEYAAGCSEESKSENGRKNYKTDQGHEWSPRACGWGLLSCSGL